MRVIKKNKTVLSCQEGASLYPDTPIDVIQRIEYVRMGPGTRFKRPFAFFCCLGWKEMQFRVLLARPSLLMSNLYIHFSFCSLHQDTMAALVRGLGAVLRGTGKTLEEIGCALQGKLAYRETRKFNVIIKSSENCIRCKQFNLLPLPIAHPLL